MGNRPARNFFEDSLVGMQLDEYRLEALLGSGGMARVYRALDVNLDRPAAIKVIDTPYRADAGYAQRFKREAQAIAQLDHPRIVHLYRYGQVGDLLYMAMQFIHGANLGDVLNAYRQDEEYIDPAEASRIVREVGEALDYAHNMGVIHRDVKPTNIMLDRQGRAILTDFGLAFLSNQSIAGDGLGSPHYLAPEQAIPAARVLPQSDLYALGIILFEMLTGRRPFSGSDPYELAQKHIQEPPPQPRSIRPEISPEIEQVMLQALEKDPLQRFETGRAMADALDSALLAGPLPQLPGQKTISERVQEKLAVPLPPAPIPIPTTSVQPAEVETGFASQTQLSWEEQHRRDPGASSTILPPVTDPVALPARQPRAARRSSTALLVPLLLLLACIALSALAAWRMSAIMGGGGAPPSVTPTLVSTIAMPGLPIPNTAPEVSSTPTPTTTPSLAATGAPPALTNTPIPLTITYTPVSPTTTRTAQTPTSTNTSTALPPTLTHTPIPPTPTNTVAPPTATAASAAPPTETPPSPVQATPTDLPPPTATDPVEFNESNETRTIICTGVSVTVTGNHNTLSLIGTCNQLLVSGNTNNITYESLASINDIGNNNTIRRR